MFSRVFRFAARFEAKFEPRPLLLLVLAAIHTAHARASAEPDEKKSLPRKLAEQELRQSEAKTRDILRAIPDLTFLHSMDGGVYVDCRAADPDMRQEVSSCPYSNARIALCGSI